MMEKEDITTVLFVITFATMGFILQMIAKGKLGIPPAVGAVFGGVVGYALAPKGK